VPGAVGAAGQLGDAALAVGDGAAAAHKGGRRAGRQAERQAALRSARRARICGGKGEGGEGAQQRALSCRAGEAGSVAESRAVGLACCWRGQAQLPVPWHGGSCNPPELMGPLSGSDMPETLGVKVPPEPHPTQLSQEPSLRGGPGCTPSGNRRPSPPHRVHCVDECHAMFLRAVRKLRPTARAERKLPTPRHPRRLRQCHHASFDMGVMHRRAQGAGASGCDVLATCRGRGAVGLVDLDTQCHCRPSVIPRALEVLIRA
jgi:hypothetical protein